MKSVLITGYLSGIGLCLAKGLKQKGYRVFTTVKSNGDIKKLKNFCLLMYPFNVL